VNPTDQRADEDEIAGKPYGIAGIIGAVREDARVRSST
jgi:hypothetical protein